MPRGPGIRRYQDVEPVEIACDTWRWRRGEWRRTVEISAHVLNLEHAQSYAALLKAYDIAPDGHPVVVAPAEP